VKPILVTGINRSGTTWVGQTLARAPGVALVYEPFSPRHRRGILRAPTPAWFTYVSGDPPAGLAADVQRNMQVQCLVQDGQVQWLCGDRSAQIDLIVRKRA